jgi:putative membrane protein
MVGAMNDSSDPKQELAEERTETAHKRTLLAEERTYSAWVRTGMAATATGFAIIKLMSEAGPTWLIRLLGSLFMVVGGVMFVLGFWAYRGALRQLAEDPAPAIPVWVIGALSTALVLGTAAGLGIILLE